MKLSEATFFDVEADRGGRVIVVAGVRGEASFRIEVARLSSAAATADLERALGRGLLAGHNIIEFDRARLAAPPLSFDVSERELLDTLVLSTLAFPDRPSHALDKPGRTLGKVPDPLADALAARELAFESERVLGQLEPGVARCYAALLGDGPHAPIARLLCDDSEQPELAAITDELAEALRSKLCRVRLPALIESVSGEGKHEERLALALALRFIELHGRSGRLGQPPSPRLNKLARFNELLARLLGPLCPDPVCVHRSACEVHRPFAREILERNFELSEFRPHQEEIVHAVLDGRRPFVVLPTGGGKSLCYQLPAVHGADRLCALSVVISPLQALMADQVQALSQRYPRACYVNSTLLQSERQRHFAGLRSGAYNVLYIGPEQLRNSSVLQLLRARPPFLWVIDEAHCISQWGHSFRTDYTYLPRAIADIHRGRSLPLLGLFTATATPGVAEDVTRQFKAGLGVELTRLDFGAARENLDYEVIAADGTDRKDRELVGLLAAFPAGSRLIYCATVRTARDVAEMLRERGIDTALYHGKLSPLEKAEQLGKFLSGRSRTVVATSAFGMGIDKPDIRLVVHYELPGSLEDYLQETGRAGRDGAPARCVLLFCEDDLRTQFFLASAGRITGRDVRYVFRALSRRARRFRRGADQVELWIAPEDLFVDESLEEELEWARDDLNGKLKLVLYHLEADGVLQRLENRTRVFGIVPLHSTLEAARAQLPAQASPATVRVLEYLYDAKRPEKVSAFDIADASGLLPREAFRELSTLLELRVIGQDLTFQLTLSRGVPGATREQMRRTIELGSALFEADEDRDENPVLQPRSAALGVSQKLGRTVRPHEVFGFFSVLRKLGLLWLDKLGPGRFQVRFDPSYVLARDRVRELFHTCSLLVGHVESKLPGQGRDLSCTLDVDVFLRSSGDLFGSERIDRCVDACLLLHHIGAWHLSDPPIVFETALKVLIDTTKRVKHLDLLRPRRHHEHEISLVHLMRHYAILPTQPERARYLEAYFSLERPAFLERYFRGRKRQLARPVTDHAEARMLEGLTEAQRRVVQSEARAILVVAGPGSGKTHAVVRRIVHMVWARQIRPVEILALAFNRAAVSELRARLEHELGDLGRRVLVQTFHGLALRLAGGELEEDDASPEERLNRAIPRAAELLEGADEGSLDESPEELRRRLLGPIRHVLVDEYQDLDPDQFRMLAALVGLDPHASGNGRTERSVFVVGDDDQAIYGFRDASLEFIQRFEAEFAAERHCLVENFRSAQPIVTACASFIQQNPDRIKLADREQLRPAPCAPAGDERSVRRFSFVSLEQAAAHAAYSVGRSLTEEQGTMAVLARHWADLDPLRAELEAANIPFELRHRDRHRPLHRRYPVDRLLRELWKKPEHIDGALRDHVAGLLAAWRRSPDEPPLALVLELASELDAAVTFEQESRAGAHDHGRRSKRELVGAVLALARESPAATSVTGHDSIRAPAARAPRVHLATFHGAKGLEFDKVIVLPTRGSSSNLPEERRAYYVAMTRARRELCLATLGDSRELCASLDVPLVDVRRFAQLRAPRVGYFDASPRDVQLTSPELSRAQRVIARLREGDALELDAAGSRARLLAQGELVAVLSHEGQRALLQLRENCPGPIYASVHEVFVHYLDKPRSGVEPLRRTLVVLPAIRAGELATGPRLARAERRSTSLAPPQSASTRRRS